MDTAGIVREYGQVLQPKFLDILRSTRGLSWASFVLDVNKGAGGSDEYTLEVITEHPEDTSWKGASAFEASTRRKLKVEVAKAKTFKEVRNVAPRTAQPYDPNSKNPFGRYSLGRSIGVEQLDGPGTLGGFITVDSAGKPRVYGLTNNHVVNIGKTTNTQPTSPTYIETGNTIYCPNYHDLEATKIQTGNSKISSYKVGKVKTASGRGLAMPVGAVHPCLVDWALIDLNTETLKNMTSANPKLKANAQLPRTPQEQLTKPYPTSISYDPNVHLVPGMSVHKWGRTTGVTSGEVKLVRSVMNIAAAEQWKGSIHNPNGTTEIAELVVGPRRSLPFCEPGDSGSLVVDDAGHVVGLLCARANDDTLVTDIRVVFESIRAALKLGPTVAFNVTPNFA
ncbi:hypothetical protein F4678DRAFT_456743 [Xylaria arbuscula]|nr:hypothetical protein F4678DRAFT_456743 [Xylaria arbuscula]